MLIAPKPQNASQAPSGAARIELTASLRRVC